jgi:hypothetical protein
LTATNTNPQGNNMSFITQEVNSMDQAALDSAGKLSDALRESGAHAATIKAVYETVATKYKALTIELETAGGSVRIFEFAGMPKTDSAEDVEKANKKTKKVIDILARVAKAAGLKDLKAAVQSPQAGVDAKGNETTTFPKLAGKKITVVTFKEIQPDAKGEKAYANQAVDTFKILDKDGKDAMGRDRLEAFGKEAESRIEIHWQHTENPLCIAKLQVEQEALLGNTSATPAAAPAKKLDGMPDATATTAATTEEAATPVASDDDDI